MEIYKAFKLHNYALQKYCIHKYTYDWTRYNTTIIYELWLKYSGKHSSLHAWHTRVVYSYESSQYINLITRVNSKYVWETKYVTYQHQQSPFSLVQSVLPYYYIYIYLSPSFTWALWGLWLMLLRSILSLSIICRSLQGITPSLRNLQKSVSLALWVVSKWSSEMRPIRTSHCEHSLHSSSMLTECVCVCVCMCVCVFVGWLGEGCLPSSCWLMDGWISLSSFILLRLVCFFPNII